jgi:hypothetical protein
MRQPAAQWVNCLALIFGGIALFLPVFGPGFSYMFINFLVFGAILGFLWPERGWQWGVWLAIPALVLGLSTIVQTQGFGVIPTVIELTAQAIIAGALTGWLGSKFSPRRLPFTDFR